VGYKHLTAESTIVRCHDRDSATRDYAYLALNADQEDVCWQEEWVSLVGMQAVVNAALLVEKALQEQRLQKMQPAAETSRITR